MTRRPLTAVERLVSFWLSFAVGYCLFRWVFAIGHLAAVLAYINAGVGIGLAQIERLVRAK